jgi:FAD dependent oxidoreductase TIGR03364
MATVLVVGGGVLGTMHAFVAQRRGHDVVQLEADLEAREASVRNFGLVWVSGRAAGAELDAALLARARWEEIAAEVPAIGFRPDGSLTLARHPAELAVLAALCGQPDAETRGLRLLDGPEIPAVNPAVRGEMLGGVLCTRDAIVEPGRVLPALRQRMTERGGYCHAFGRTVVAAGPGRVRDHTGHEWHGDTTVLCPGAAHTGVAAPWLVDAPLRRCRLQMMQTEPLYERLTTALADGDTLRYYPAFGLPEAEALPEQASLGAAWRSQLLVAQRAGGELTIGDTHVYDEPYDFAVDEEPNADLLARAAALLGRPLPPVRRRWAGVYSQATDASICVRVVPEPGLAVVTGPGGRGMTLSPAIAEATLDTPGVLS